MSWALAHLGRACERSDEKVCPAHNYAQLSDVRGSNSIVLRGTNIMKEKNLLIYIET